MLNKDTYLLSRACVCPLGIQNRPAAERPHLAGENAENVN